MLSKKFVDFTRYAILPFLLIVFGAMTLLTGGTAFARAFPYYHSFFLFFAVITIERVYSYSRAVSQRHMIWRDLMSTAVQTFVAGAVMAAIVLPVFALLSECVFGSQVFVRALQSVGPIVGASPGSFSPV